LIKKKLRLLRKNAVKTRQLKLRESELLRSKPTLPKRNVLRSRQRQRNWREQELKRKRQMLSPKT